MLKKRASHTVTRYWVAALAFVALIGAGCSKPWRVVAASGPPSALTQVRKVVVTFDYSDAKVEGVTEEAWLEQKKAEQADYATTWEEFKQQLEAGFVEEFADDWPSGVVTSGGTAAEADAATLRVEVNYIKVGYFVPVVPEDTGVDATMVWLVDGEQTDAIETGALLTPNAFIASVSRQMLAIGRRLGMTAADFLKSKQA